MIERNLRCSERPGAGERGHVRGNAAAALHPVALDAAELDEQVCAGRDRWVDRHYRDARGLPVPRVLGVTAQEEAEEPGREHEAEHQQDHDAGDDVFREVSLRHPWRR